MVIPTIIAYIRTIMVNIYIDQRLTENKKWRKETSMVENENWVYLRTIGNTVLIKIIDSLNCLKSEMFSCLVSGMSLENTQNLLWLCTKHNVFAFIMIRNGIFVKCILAFCFEINAANQIALFCCALIKINLEKKAEYFYSFIDFDCYFIFYFWMWRLECNSR